jgi:hypothetical protein
MLAGNPKENLIRAIDAYLGADAHTSSTRALFDQLRTLKSDVEQAPNPVARSTGATHADLIDEATRQVAPSVHVHVHTSPTPDSQVAAQVKERLRRA